MRAPSQLTRESADEYVVGNPHGLTIDAVHYARGATIAGEVARSVATFRSLLGVAWLIPVKNAAPQASVPVQAEPRRPRRT